LSPARERWVRKLKEILSSLPKARAQPQGGAPDRPN